MSRPEASPARTGAPPSPYKGLSHYTEEDAGFFFGRESERQIIIANLTASRLTLVYGASGVGKSSLLRAAVVRHLRDLTQRDLAEFGEAEFLPVVFTAWKDDPPGELLNCIRVAAEDLLGKTPTIPEGRLDEQLAAISAELDVTLLIVLDQFEEYFLYHPQDEGAGTFAGEFPRAVNRRDLRVNFIVSIREDALAMLDRFKGRIPTLFENYLRIDHLKRDAAHDAIVKPIEEFNRLTPDEEPVRIEPELVEAVLDQIRTGAVVLGQTGEGTVDGGKRTNGGAPGEDRIETPYLQLVMSRLWTEELGSGSRVLRLETLDRLGGAQKIVRTHLDEAMAELEAKEQDAAATIFRQLVTPSGTKIAHTVPDLADYARVSSDELLPVLERLSGGDVRILRPVAPPPGQLDGGRYEIFHDVLAPAILDWRTRFVEAKTRREAEREAEAARAEARREKRRARIFRAVAIVAIACAVLAAILGVFTWRQKQTAKSRTLAAQALADLAVDPVKSIDEALSALKIKRTQDAVDSLRRAFSEARVRRIVNVRGGAVNDVAVSPDGKYLATADDDSTAKVWDRKTGALAMPPLAGDTKPVNAVAFSPNSRLLATASDDHTARVWNLKTNGVEVLPHDAAVTSVAFARNGRRVFTVSGGKLRAWRLPVRAKKPVWTKSASDGQPIDQVSASTTDDLLATGDDGGGVQLWDAATGAKVGAPSTSHQVPINSVGFSHDGSMVVSSSIDGTVIVWPFETGGIYVLIAPGGVPVDARFSVDDQLVAVGYEDDTVRIFDWSTQKPLLEMRGHGGGVTGLQFTPDGRDLVTSSDDNTVRIWNASLGRIVRTPDAVESVAFSDDGSRVAYSGYGFAQVARTGARAPIGQLKPAQAPVPAIAFAPGSHGRLAAFAVKDAVRLWDPAKPASTLLVRSPGGTVNDLAYSPDGKRLATASSDGVGRIWDLATKKADPVLTGHKGALNTVAFSPDGKFVATGGIDQTVRIWNSRHEAPPRVLRSSGEVKGLAFSAHGHLLAGASAGLQTSVWDYETGKRVLKLRTSSVDGVAFSPDGRYLVTVGADTLTRVWDTGNGHPVAVLREHADEVTTVAFSPHGREILTGSADRTAKLYPCVTCASLNAVVRRARDLLKTLHGT